MEEHIIIDKADVDKPYYLNDNKRVDLLSNNSKYSSFPDFKQPIAYEAEQNLHFLYHTGFGEKVPNMEYQFNKFCKYNRQETLKNIPNKEPNVIRLCTYNVHNWVKPCILNDQLQYDTDFKENKKNHQPHISLLCDDIKSDIVALQELVPIFEYVNEVEQTPKTDVDIEKGSLKPIYDQFNKNGLQYGTIADSFYIEKSVDKYYFLGNAIFSKYQLNKIH